MRISKLACSDRKFRWFRLYEFAAKAVEGEGGAGGKSGSTGRFGRDSRLHNGERNRIDVVSERTSPSWSPANKGASVATDGLFRGISAYGERSRTIFGYRPREEESPYFRAIDAASGGGLFPTGTVAAVAVAAKKRIKIRTALEGLARVVLRSNESRSRGIK